MKLTNELVVQKESELLDAMLSSNVSQLKTLLADEMIFVNQDGLVLTKNEDLKIHESGLLKIHKLDASDQKVALFGDTAVVTVSIALRGAYSGQEFSGKFKYSRTWKELSDNLQVISAQCTGLK